VVLACPVKVDVVVIAGSDGSNGVVLPPANAVLNMIEPGLRLFWSRVENAVARSAAVTKVERGSSGAGGPIIRIAAAGWSRFVERFLRERDQVLSVELGSGPMHEVDRLVLEWVIPVGLQALVLCQAIHMVRRSISLFGSGK